MLIDWFTVVAQAINFLILVWLMKRFLYRPILNAIDEREARIAAELADADSRKAEAAKERDEFQRKNEAFDADRSERLAKATEEAAAERQRLIEAARKAAAELATRRQAGLEAEAATLSHGLSRRAQREVFAIARQVLGDLAGASLEERAVEVFLRLIRDIDEPTRTGLADALRASPSGRIRTAFDLTEAQRASIQHVLNETFSADIQLGFETAPELVSGIEFAAHGTKVAWTVADYLLTLEEGATKLLDRRAKAEAGT
ncbi:ATP synthase subunit b [Planctomycetes bacterium Poly30]|uniref:ATP synthase subunit b n=1 Tax=Saltatorellus ferox TaxID=2528018 RepID=A0A518EVJ5_9BACT|nr:ATP synthase subunit b [Planctomycetes bacterium Poly30]